MDVVSGIWIFAIRIDYLHIEFCAKYNKIGLGNISPSDFVTDYY